jgi:DNA end-binding protein Ku
MRSAIDSEIDAGAELLARGLELEEEGIVDLLDLLDLAKHIVNQKSGSFEPEKFEDHYEPALIDLINQKRAGRTIRPKERPKAENVVDLLEALRRSAGGAAAEIGAQKKFAQKASEGFERAEGNADVDRGQEAGERD